MILLICRLNCQALSVLSEREKCRAKLSIFRLTLCLKPIGLLMSVLAVVPAEPPALTGLLQSVSSPVHPVAGFDLSGFGRRGSVFANGRRRLVAANNSEPVDPVMVNEPRCFLGPDSPMFSGREVIRSTRCRKCRAVRSPSQLRPTRTVWSREQWKVWNNGSAGGRLVA